MCTLLRLRCHQTWLAGKSSKSGGFVRWQNHLTKWVIFRQATDLTTGGYRIRNTNRLGTVINPIHCYSYSQHPRYVWGVKSVDEEVKNPVSSMWLYNLPTGCSNPAIDGNIPI